MRFKHNKSFGQNFIKDSFIIDSIVDGSLIDKDTLVIEVGPGMGALSEKIIPLSKYTILYEIDKRLENILNNKLNDNNNYELIIDDFLSVDVLTKLNKYDYKKLYFISNLPYYITTPIINKLIEEKILPDKIVIMLQKEVADRFKATINSRDYGYFTVLLNAYYDINKLLDVPKEYFEPVPKVDSSVIIMNKNNNLIKIGDIDIFNKLIKDAFKYKRKNLKNNLNMYDLDLINIILQKYNLDITSRAENISLNIFIEIANSLC